MLESKHFTRTPHARGHLIKSQQHIMLQAQFLYPVKITVRHRYNSTGTNNRLQYNSGNCSAPLFKKLLQLMNFQIETNL
ncbi:hypothetical protein D3C74_315510 [compost metagenome]